jgi:hypothetical protein
MVSLETTPEELLATLDNDLQRVYAISTPNVTLTDLLLVQIAREIKKLAVRGDMQAQPQAQAQSQRRK